MFINVPQLQSRSLGSRDSVICENYSFWIYLAFPNLKRMVSHLKVHMTEIYCYLLLSSIIFREHWQNFKPPIRILPTFYYLWLAKGSWLMVVPQLKFMGFCVYLVGIYKIWNILNSCLFNYKKKGVWKDNYFIHNVTYIWNVTI